MAAKRWRGRILEWYDRNPIDVILVISFSLLLIFGWGQMSSMIGWVILTAYLINSGVRLFRGIRSTEKAEDEKTETGEDPLQELQHRYARGEIGDEEFERKLERLVEAESLERTDDYDDRELQTERS